MGGIFAQTGKRWLSLGWIVKTGGCLGIVTGGEDPRLNGDVGGWGSSFCGEAAVVLAAVKDARRRFAVAFGHP